MQEARQHGSPYLSVCHICPSHVPLIMRGCIVDAIGEHFASDLRADRVVTLTAQCRLRFFSKQTLPGTAQKVVVLACWPTSKLLNKLDSIHGISTLVVLPFTLEEIQPWLGANGAEDILGVSNVAKAQVKNQTVLRALESIRASINMSGRLTNPSDRDRVIDAFRLLRKAGEFANVTEVRAWLQQEGMDPETAEEASRIATDPTRFRKSSSSPNWASDIIQKWQGKKP
jgi:hypothetical protein